MSALTYASLVLVISGAASAQDVSGAAGEQPSKGSTSTDVFVMFGSDVALGIMKNFALPKTKFISGYTWIQAGLTSMTGNAQVENRLYNGEAVGAIVHFNDHNAIWIQETFNKIVTAPWYTTSSIGYTWSR